MEFTESRFLLLRNGEIDLLLVLWLLRSCDAVFLLVAGLSVDTVASLEFSALRISP